MSDKLVRIIREPIHEGSSYDFEIDEFFQIDESTLTISNVKVYVYLTGNDPPEYINDRDGTNNEGLTLLNNKISFHMSPDDNTIILTDQPNNYYEKHTVLFEIFYNDGTDKFYLEFEMKIKNLSIIE